jgi:hypothetical protein
MSYKLTLYRFDQKFIFEYKKLYFFVKFDQNKVLNRFYIYLYNFSKDGVIIHEKILN